MFINARTLLLLIVALFSISYNVSAHNDVDEEQYEYKQKLILVQGKNSRVMKGESTPIYNFNKKKVLPYYLSRGWTIQHIYFNETANANTTDAYVVIEKWNKINKRFSRR